MSIKAAASTHHQGRPIISLASAFQSRRGGWADDIGCELVSCDDPGNIRVWQAHSSGSYVDTGLEVKAGSPCCSLAVRKGFIVAAGTDGSVRIYNLVRTWCRLQRTSQQPSRQADHQQKQGLLDMQLAPSVLTLACSINWHTAALRITLSPEACSTCRGQEVQRQCMLGTNPFHFVLLAEEWAATL